MCWPRILPLDRTLVLVWQHPYVHVDYSDLAGIKQADKCNWQTQCVFFARTDEAETHLPMAHFILHFGKGDTLLHVLVRIIYWEERYFHHRKIQ